ncbi:thiolase family protein [Salinirussus salinus]|uniref:thiolase family protein n=1 Tax=Salinirussus salinus TaxID=1198300 RepID=UPI0013567A7C|nr:thiolase family protein [Salinirussus salinus]
MTDAYITGTSSTLDREYDLPERDLALHAILEALDGAGAEPTDIDGLYLPKPRPWAEQGFFSTLLSDRLGIAPDRRMEVYTGGTSGGNAVHAAVGDVRAGRVETAVVAAVERNSTIDTADYFEYILGIFDREFQAPAGPSVPGMYAQSLQRYCHEFGADREAVAAIAAKNRSNAAGNPGAVFGEELSAAEVLDSRPIADPLRLLECPTPCDGAAALVVTSAPGGDGQPVRVSGIGAGHATSHLLGVRDGSLARFPAVGTATGEALADAGAGAADVDVFEPYAPFPHVEAVITEELGLYDPGEGAAACVRGETAVDGPHPVSPSGGCLGRGHPAMVTPLLNCAAAVEQLRGEAPNQVPGAERALTTSEHGHVDGVTATVLEVAR